MFCCNCGRQLEQKFKFCPSCGTKRSSNGSTCEEGTSQGTSQGWQVFLYCSYIIQEKFFWKQNYSYIFLYYFINYSTLQL